METIRALTRLDRLFLARAYELAARGIGSPSPNPPVGAVIVRDGRIVGEGYHHRAGGAHAEVNALAQAGELARGATLYVSLEPCNHVGATPPCTRALIDAGIVRIVVGTIDPNPRTDGRGIAALHERGIEVEVAEDPRAKELIEIFAGSIELQRPYVSLKMAMSIDGAITSKSGVQEWITSEAWRSYVRELRIAHDAVMVGAGTVRVDDPQLTVRPAHHRLRPYVRVVACETDTVPESSRVFETVEDYERTIVLAPAGLRDRFERLNAVARVLFVGDDGDRLLDLTRATHSLREEGIYSVLCEGGPTLAARLIAARLVDRCYWAIAPVFLQGNGAVPVLAGAELAALDRKLCVDRVLRAGEDVVLSGTFVR
ncbi:MAG TPA: bifunctional diaminohydroxyphosphoribosylaminopyrimidine deaminase/5-amino-6-(5-phosphoribosylamino)uracil reductase RibD [Candidatus Baltobacteraceae bacterium]|nr:bifunctional diaminohydroxyphosphoribosylaminopyrimidine deaminase/5-amino-6-(5-phosphoribosylamino)uracil reductase RibD [Candidatus Baltobacteraceae bacterium]